MRQTGVLDRKEAKHEQGSKTVGACGKWILGFFNFSFCCLSGTDFGWDVARGHRITWLVSLFSFRFCSMQQAYLNPAFGSEGRV